MLGLGRASEYAGWWNTGLKKISFTGTSAMTKTVQQSPSYSLTSDQAGSGVTFTGVNADTFSGVTVAAGAVNTTGLTGFTGYNASRLTIVHSFYLPWASGLTSISGSLNVCNLEYTSSSAYYFGQNVQISSGGVLSFSNTSFGSPLTLSGSYTNYTNKWLTFVTSAAETSSVFQNWTGGTQGSNTVAYRNALYNSLTGQLIASVDFWATPTNLPMPLGSIGNSVPMFISSASGPYPSLSIVLSNPSNTSTTITHGVLWYTLGQMFDPFQTTDTS